MASQKPIATLFSKQENQSDNQGSVSSAPGHDVEESKEESPDEDIVISIKSLRSTTSFNILVM